MNISGFSGQTMIRGPAAISIGNETDVTRDIIFRRFSLAFPCIGAERQAAAENVGSSRAPVLAVDLGGVIGGKRVHVRVFLVADVSLSSRSAWPRLPFLPAGCSSCLLYTSDAADDLLC